MCPESFGGVRFDLGPLLQGRMWYLIVDTYDGLYLPIIGHRGFQCEDSLWEIMCPESFGGSDFTS